MKRLVWLSLAILLVASPAFSQYTFITVDYPGALHTRLVGLNDHLDIVGNYQLPGAVRHAMLYSKGKFVPLDPDGLLGTWPSGATQINNSGDIVGWYQVGAIRHGFLLQAGALTTIDYPGAAWSQVNGVTDGGTVFGEFVASDGSYHGFIVEGGSVRQLEDYPGSLDSIPFYMNARGDIAGEWENDPLVLGHGFVLSKEGEWTSFDAPGAADNSTLAIGINDHRQILGVFDRPDGQRRAFVLDGHDIAAARYTIVEMPGTSPFPETMNNAGVFVGLYTDHGVVRGFIASPVPRR